MALAVLALIVAVLLHTQPACGRHEETLEVGRTKRILPDNKSCDPRRGECKKGDWVDSRIADCKYKRSWTSWTCDVRGASIFSWEVEPDEDDRCKPAGKKPIRCGDPGTNTRCVCSDYKIKIDTCVCQYWTEETPGENEPAFCTGYYCGGVSGVHHWACCNNCNDSMHNSTCSSGSGSGNNHGSGSGNQHLTPISSEGRSSTDDAEVDCDGVTYQGGSDESYCGACGTNIAENKGRKKYHFNCGGCTFQSACQTTCSKKYLGLITLPALCWKWLDCFYGCCKKVVSSQTQQSGTDPIPVNSEIGDEHKEAAFQSRDKRFFAISPGLVASLEFCGDGNCTGLETYVTCPGDCCHQINAAVCPNDPCQCTPSCCQEETCCLDAETAGAAQAIGPLGGLYLIIVAMFSCYI